MNVSKGSKLPALPPKSGCLVCGESHGAESCNLSQEVIGHDPSVFRRIAAVQRRRDANEAFERRMALLARIPTVAAADLSEAVNACQDATNAAARRRFVR